MNDNRIANTLEESGPLGMGSATPAAPTLMPPPISPEPQALGVQLDNAVAQPAMPAEVPPGAENAAAAGMVGESILGGSPFNGALMGVGL